MAVFRDPIWWTKFTNLHSEMQNIWDVSRTRIAPQIVFLRLIFSSIRRDMYRIYHDEEHFVLESRIFNAQQLRHYSQVCELRGKLEVAHRDDTFM